MVGARYTIFNFVFLTLFLCIEYLVGVTEGTRFHRSLISFWAEYSACTWRIPLAPATASQADRARVQLLRNTVGRCTDSYDVTLWYSFGVAIISFGTGSHIPPTDQTAKRYLTSLIF